MRKDKKWKWGVAASPQSGWGRLESTIHDGGGREPPQATFGGWLVGHRQPVEGGRATPTLIWSGLATIFVVQFFFFFI